MSILNSERHLAAGTHFYGHFQGLPLILETFAATIQEVRGCVACHEWH
jgi:hypothetical protein